MTSERVPVYLRVGLGVTPTFMRSFWALSVSPFLAPKGLTVRDRKRREESVECVSHSQE